MIKKQNAFIKENSIVPVYDIEERDIAKFNKLIENTKYVQSMELTNESSSKEKYFMIATKKDYEKAVVEVKSMIKYIYPDREEEERQEYQRENTPIIHNNVSTYTQDTISLSDSDIWFIPYGLINVSDSNTIVLQSFNITNIFAIKQ